MHFSLLNGAEINRWMYVVIHVHCHVLRPVQTNELNAAEKELLDLLRLKFFEKDKKPGALDVWAFLHLYC